MSLTKLEMFEQYAATVGVSPEEMIEVGLTNYFAEHPRAFDIEEKLNGLFNDARTKELYSDEGQGEKLDPWPTLAAMVVDLLDDVVDVWIDDYREKS